MAAMIAAVWVLSAVISIPPLFGWKAEGRPGECVVSQHIGYQARQHSLPCITCCVGSTIAVNVPAE